MSQDNVSMSLAVEFGCWLVEIVKGSFTVKQSNSEAGFIQEIATIFQGPN